MSAALEIWAPGTLGEVDAGADLARLLLDGCRQEGLSLQDGDIVVITSKVVSKAEGRVAAGDREEAIRAETVALLAERGATQVVRSRLGLVHAAAGVDASGVSPGQIALLPLDPDASARVVRERCQELAGVTVGVLISDTAGRPWRMGQTDLAIGAAGVRVLDDHSGRDDGYGNRLAVTCPAVADELCSAAELASGKTGRRPLVVIRGRADLVLPAGQAGPGARALQRPIAAEWFGLGAREAVLAALRGDPSSRPQFGAPASVAEMLAALRSLGWQARIGAEASPTIELDGAPEDPDPLAALAHACGWHSVTTATGTRLRPDGP